MWPPTGRARFLTARIGPFAGACLLAWVVVPVKATVDWREYWLSMLVALVAGTIAGAALVARRHTWVAVVPSALLLLAGVALLRDSAGGIATGAGALAILPVFQTALYSRSRRHLGLVLGAVGLFFLVPIWLVGSPEYPQAQYRTVLLAVAADAIIGLTVQQLVGRVRDEAAAARRQQQMLQRVSTVVHGLFDSPRPRAEACEAALEIALAGTALLFEPSADADELVCTVTVGFQNAESDPVVPRGSPAYEAMATGRPVLLTGNVGGRVGLVDAWEASGSPSSILYQPLIHRGRRLAVMVVGWFDHVRADGPRATAIGLLAHEAAAVISRADAMSDLSDAALTDELTGLPNRRAWQQRLSRADNDERTITIGMLDLDRFKQFNDAHGHPTGDLLLRQTAAAWNEQLRPTDLLARIGGEEFGLLLCDCDELTARRIVARLQEAVTHDQTCSAGIATMQPGETAEFVVMRADAALYRAKASGRDTAAFSPA